MHRPILFVIAIAILWSGNAFAWGHHPEFARYPENYLFKNILKNKKIHYCVISENDLDPLLQEQIRASFMLWLRDINTYVVYDENGNSVDITKTLIFGEKCAGIDEKNVLDNLSKAKSTGSVDIIFQESAKICQANNMEGGCLTGSPSTEPAKKTALAFLIAKGFLGNAASYATVLSAGHKPLIILPSVSFYNEATAIHEIGHALGLADQYYKPTYRLEYADKIDPAYSTSNHTPSLMSAEAETLTCDDITAALFAFDRYAGHNNRIFPSICDNEQGIYISSKREGRWVLKELDEYDTISSGEYVRGLKEGTWTVKYTDPSYGRIKGIVIYSSGDAVSSEYHFDDGEGKLHERSKYIKDKLITSVGYSKKGMKTRDVSGNEHGFAGAEKDEEGNIREMFSYDYKLKEFQNVGLYKNGKPYFKLIQSGPNSLVVKMYDEKGNIVDSQSIGPDEVQKKLETKIPSMENNIIAKMKSFAESPVEVKLNSPKAALKGVGGGI